MSNLTPPDPTRCQAEVPTHGPFGCGGPSGDPRNGYRARCSNEPVVIATEREPADDGQRGSMSLCERCKAEFIKQLGEVFADFEPVPHDEVASSVHPIDNAASSHDHGDTQQGGNHG